MNAAATVRIVVPANWHTVAGRDLRPLACQVGTAGEALRWLVGSYPEFGPRLFGRDGQLACWVNVYLGEDDIRDLGGLDTPITAPDSLTIVPALAGG